MMTLGMIEHWNEAGFNKVAGLGLKAIEFCYNIGREPAELMAQTSDIRKWSVAAGIKVGSVEAGSREIARARAQIRFVSHHQQW